MPNVQGALLAQDGNEDQMQLFGFLPKRFGRFAEFRFCFHDHAQPVFGFTGFLSAVANLLTKLLFC